MKIFYTILLAFLSLSLSAQETDLQKKLYAKREIADCEAIMLNAANMAAQKLKAESLDTLTKILDLCTDTCGITECTQRLTIINTILQNQPSLEAIETYYKNEFHSVLKNRILDSKTIDYQLIYNENRFYFGYVPLRHPLDSIVEYHASKLLKTLSLTDDEALICTLFSGDVSGFDRMLKEIEEENKPKPEEETKIVSATEETAAPQTPIKKRYKDMDYWKFHDVTVAVYAGMYGPLGSGEQVIGYNPLIGFTGVIPINDRLFAELGAKLRIHLNDSNFDYFAQGETQTVNSDLGVFLGGTLGYKLLYTKRFVFSPKIGAGYEMVSTGIWEEKNNEGDRKYYNLQTVNFTLGVMAMTPVFVHSFIGLAANVHYCPYHLNKKLRTEFINNAASIELFFVF